MEENSASLRKLSKLAGITHPCLRALCLGQGNPTESTLRQLSKVLGIHPVELYFLVFGDKIKASADEQMINGPCLILFQEIDRLTTGMPVEE